MNWDRNRWSPEASQGQLDMPFGENYVYSNVRHTWGETLNSGPFAIECRDMVEANKLTLLFYRQACRLLPSIINRQGNLTHMDYHKSKLNLAKWIRKSSNIRDPMEVTKAIRISYDFLFACAYCDFESGYFNRYLVDQPTRTDGSWFTDVKKSRGLNLIDYNRFKNKSNFLQRFVKGVKPLLH